MKNHVLKTGLLTLAVAATSLFALNSCKKEEDPKPKTLQEQIAGTWDFTSFRIDSFEYMGLIVDSSHVTFKAYTGAQGDFEQRVRYTDGEVENIAGKYEVDEVQKRIKMTTSQTSELVKISLPDDEHMHWEGLDPEGYLIKVQMKRR